jgi:hypothetical protein
MKLPQYELCYFNSLLFSAVISLVLSKTGLNFVYFSLVIFSHHSFHVLVDAPGVTPIFNSILWHVESCEKVTSEKYTRFKIFNTLGCHNIEKRGLNYV